MMKENKMIVALGVAALSLAGVMTSLANPLAIDMPKPTVIFATTNAVANRVELEKATNKVVEGLAELGSLLANESKNGSDNIFIYREGSCYSFEVTKRLRSKFVVFQGFEYCEDDSYLLGGGIVSGRELESKLLELARDGKYFGRNKQSDPIIAYCLKVGIKKVSGDRRRYSFFDDDVDF